MAFPDHPQLKPVEIGQWEHYILGVFWELYNDRPLLMDGSRGPITMRSLLDYQTLFEDKLFTDEISVIHSLDRAYLTTMAEINRNG